MLFSVAQQTSGSEHVERDDDAATRGTRQCRSCRSHHQGTERHDHAPRQPRPEQRHQVFGYIGEQHADAVARLQSFALQNGREASGLRQQVAIAQSVARSSGRQFDSETVLQPARAASRGAGQGIPDGSGRTSDNASAKGRLTPSFRGCIVQRRTCVTFEARQHAEPSESLVTSIGTHELECLLPKFCKNCAEMHGLVLTQFLHQFHFSLLKYSSSTAQHVNTDYRRRCRRNSAFSTIVGEKQAQRRPGMPTIMCVKNDHDACETYRMSRIQSTWRTPADDLG